MFFAILRAFWLFWSIFSATNLYFQWLSRLDIFKRTFAVEKEQPSRMTGEKEQRTGLLPLTVSNLILRELSPLDRCRYSLANKEAYDAVSSFNRQAHRIQHILSPYFNHNEIQVFRLIQLKTDTLISGSSALQFFDLSIFEDSDLDLYIVRDWDKVMLLAGFLTSIAYDYMPRTDQPQTLQQAFEAGRTRHVEPNLSDEYSSRDIWDVYSFIRRSDGKKIQIITCKKNIIQVILGFHSTCVMNVISYTHAYALYPHATFIEKRSIAIKSGRPQYGRASVSRALEKYNKRGWHTSLVPSKANALRSRSEFRETARSVGDSACWVIPLASVQRTLSMHDIDNPPSAVDAVRANSWYTIIMDNGSTRVGFSVTKINPQNSQTVFPFTLASIPPALNNRMGLTADYFGENKTIFTSQRSIENLIELTRKTFDVEPDIIHEHVRKIVSRACDTIPQFMNLQGKRLRPSLYSLVMLIRQMDIIFNSFREDPSCSITFRIDPHGHIWTWSVITLPTNYPRRLIPSLRMLVDDYTTKHLIGHRVWISFRLGMHELDLWRSTSTQIIYRQEQR